MIPTLPNNQYGFGTKADSRKPAADKRPPVITTGLTPNLSSRSDASGPEIQTQF